MTENINSVAIIGAGTMGLGIAQVIAMAGYKVQLYDAVPGATDKAITKIKGNLQKGIDKGKLNQQQMDAALLKISTIDGLKEIESDLVIEAIIEDLEIKQQLFSELEAILSEEAILCTNTSSISVTRIAGALYVQPPGPPSRRPGTNHYPARRRPGSRPCFSR